VTGYGRSVRSVLEFLVVALLVTLTPGPGTATILRVAARDGRQAAMSAVIGNSGGVLMWGALSALGVSSLILASQIAYDTLRIVGAGALIVLGLRSLLHRHHATAPRTDPATGPATEPARAAGWRSGLVTSASNPKLAVFFVALFPQFVRPDAPVLPYALAMAAVIVALDIAWFSLLAFAVDRAQQVLKPKVQAALERFTGTVMVGLGIRLATESR
jgi:threonine/homoserine/homoserine lactone efflux protein